MRLDRFVDRFHMFKANPFLAWPLLLGNFAAVWYGYADYYRNQLAAAEPWQRPFVADSPNAVFLFGLALFLHQVGVRWHLLDLLAWVENVKVGIWTVFVLLYRYDEFFADEATLRWILFALHIGMVFQVWALHHDLRSRALPYGTFGLVAAWLLLGDWLDYGPPDLHPFLRGSPHHADVVVAFTVGLTLVTLAWAAWWYRPGRDRAREAG